MSFYFTFEETAINQLNFDCAKEKEQFINIFASPKKLISDSKIPQKKQWTEKELTKLEQIVKLYNAKNWKRIASHFPGRTSTICSQRYRRLQLQKKRTQLYSQGDEDLQIIDLVHKNGRKWKLIATIMNKRSAKQIRQRYINILDPTINKKPFTKEEDLKIIWLYYKIGTSWSEMSQCLTNRPPNMIKNRFHLHIKKFYQLKNPTNKKEGQKKVPFQKETKVLKKRKMQRKCVSLDIDNRYKNKTISSKFQKSFSRRDYISYSSNYKKRQKQYINTQSNHNLSFQNIILNPIIQMQDNEKIVSEQESPLQKKFPPLKSKSYPQSQNNSIFDIMISDEQHQKFKSFTENIYNLE